MAVCSQQGVADLDDDYEDSFEGRAAAFFFDLKSIFVANIPAAIAVEVQLQEEEASNREDDPGYIPGSHLQTAFEELCEDAFLAISRCSATASAAAIAASTALGLPYSEEKRIASAVLLGAPLCFLNGAASTEAAKGVGVTMSGFQFTLPGLSLLTRSPHLTLPHLAFHLPHPIHIAAAMVVVVVSMGTAWNWEKVAETTELEAQKRAILQTCSAFRVTSYWYLINSVMDLQPMSWLLVDAVTMPLLMDNMLVNMVSSASCGLKMKDQYRSSKCQLAFCSASAALCSFFNWKFGFRLITLPSLMSFAALLVSLPRDANQPVLKRIGKALPVACLMGSYYARFAIAMGAANSLETVGPEVFLVVASIDFVFKLGAVTSLHHEPWRPSPATSQSLLAIQDYTSVAGFDRKTGGPNWPWPIGERAS
eukprot:TRINITY_DN114328_c0_g1_i2.p1 TRINITY_DN114328_c0_g1~~TRINITY_DN114328_c0_g1_i2.p1  ORF type:complete len:423 (-),score=66.23 TRINITY_DN114328_c0_g1_i2:337-1605(-)